MTKSRSRKLAFIHKWQRILRLGDWKITYEEKAWPHKTYSGRTRFDRNEMMAVVNIRKGMTAEYWRITVVHELMHLRIPFFFPKDSWAEQELERGVEMTARALLKLEAKR